MASDVRVIEVGVEALDAARPLWMSMHRHHEAVSPMIGRFGELPDIGELWQRRRAHYEVWLAEPRSALLLAMDDDTAVGYAMVRVREPRRAWEPREPIGTLETLAVDETRRGLGIGSLLMQAVRNVLAREGAVALELSVLEGNETAIRFYERHGLRPALVTLMGPV
jgi:ribosomal protein S18 acetylase RimI-like enzyme